MNFSFENQGTNTYLVYTVSSEDLVDTMSLGMLTNNKIPGLATVIFTQMDTTKYIKYNVSARISVRQFFSGPVNRKRLIGVFNGIVDAMLSAEDYMIDVNTILLDLDYIFADVSTCDTVLVCLPIVNDDLTGTDIGTFFKNIMFSTQFDQTENCDHVAKIINYLNSTPVFSLVDFKELLNSIQNIQVSQAAVKPQPVVSQQPQPIAPQPTVQQTPAKEMPKTMPAQQPAVKQAQMVPSTPAQPNRVQPQQPVQPQMQVPPKQQPQPQVAQAPGEKKMTMFNLLMHYNKENAALYKAQKEAKKAAGNVPPRGAQPPQNGFAIPGQQAPAPATNFAIPGQPTPPPQAAPRQGMQQPNGQPKAAPVPQPMQVPQQVPQQMRPTPTPVQPAPMPQQPPVQPAPQQVYQPQVAPQAQPMNFGETTVLGGNKIGETTVLGATSTVAQVNPHLIRSKNGEKILLNKPVFRIGKEKSYVDYFVGDNSAISRSHANVISRDGGYFVVDTNSTNHTYVNGMMIQSNVEMKISNGDKIKLANEEFEFRLY